jgi:hypothetical protein
VWRVSRANALSLYYIERHSLAPKFSRAVRNGGSRPVGLTAPGPDALLWQRTRWCRPWFESRITIVCEAVVMPPGPGVGKLNAAPRHAEHKVGLSLTGSCWTVAIC